MKNLNKKIGAVALAGMVVAGGVAAAGVQSFAASESKSLIGQEQQQNNEKAERRLNFYCGFNGYKVLDSFNNPKDIKKEARKHAGISRVYSSIIDLNSENIFDKLDRLLSGRWNIVMVRYEGMYYLIGEK